MFKDATLKTKKKKEKSKWPTTIILSFAFLWYNFKEENRELAESLPIQMFSVSGVCDKFKGWVLTPCTHVTPGNCATLTILVVNGGYPIIFSITKKIMECS